MAAGMLKAYRTLKFEKLRNKDSILMLIIVSDGIANVPIKQPLSNRSRKKFLSNAQADCIDVASFLARDSVRTIIINTAHSPLEEKVREDGRHYIPENLFTPTEFLMDLTNISKGSYYGLLLKKKDEISLKTKKRSLDDWLHFEE